MNFKKHLIHFFFFCLAYLVSHSQSAYEYGFLPSINLRKSLKSNWKLNFKTESRQSLKEGVFGRSDNLRYKYLLSDFSLLASKKTSYNKSLAFGYFIRFRGDEIINRFIQQFTIIKKYSNLRIGHRFSADQTIFKNEPTDYRFRYRLSSEFPLVGQSIDPGEFYFKLNNEYLNSIQGEYYDLEIRVVPLLGYEFTHDNKVEFGLDHRINSFLDGGSKSKFWFTINWYLNL